jgi:hypothetical protein
MKKARPLIQPTHAKDILDLIPDHLLDALADETGIDYSVKKLQGKTVFKLFIYGLLSAHKISLRVLETIYASDIFQDLFGIQKRRIAHSGIGVRLKHLDFRYFEQIFLHLVASKEVDHILFDEKKINIRKIDSTIVNLSSKLLSAGLRINEGKKSLKFGVEINGGIPVNILLYEGQKYCSEDVALPELVRRKIEKSSTNIALFDRGIQRKQTFLDFTKEGISFISRATSQDFQVLETFPLTEHKTETLVITKDERVVFAHGTKDALSFLRLVTGTNKANGQEIVFLTNVDFLSAAEITELYRSRWEIETFFKFIKQELNFKHLLSRSENGIKVCMYLTMIVAILLTIYKKKNKIIGWTSTKIRFLNELTKDLMLSWHGALNELLKPDSTAQPWAG